MDYCAALSLAVTMLIIQSVTACESDEPRPITPTQIRIEDPAKRIHDLFMFAQQKEEEYSTRLLPEVHQQIVLEYCYGNDFETLFHVFPSPEDRVFFIGFDNYQQMNQTLPSWASKVHYLKTYAFPWYHAAPPTSSEWESLQNDFVYIVNEFGTITDIDWSWNNQPEHSNRELQQLFWFSSNINWSAFGRFRNLQYLNLNTPQWTRPEAKFKFSVNDLALLPSSLKYLSIKGSWGWTDRVGINLSDLPSGLEIFVLDEVENIGRTLNISAPNSMLRIASFAYHEFDEIHGWNDPSSLPPHLSYLDVSDGNQLWSIQRVADLFGPDGYRVLRSLWERLNLEVDIYGEDAVQDWDNGPENWKKPDEVKMWTARNPALLRQYY